MRARHLVIVVAVAASSGGGLLAQAPARSVVQGELARLDPAARKIVVKTDRGSQIQFEYTTDTVVNGTEKTVAGLGGRTGAVVTVQYEKQETRLLALHIEVRAKGNSVNAISLFAAPGQNLNERSAGLREFTGNSRRRAGMHLGTSVQHVDR